MPSKTAKQHRFMEGCRNNPEKMNKPCPPKRVTEEFHQADKAKSAKPRKK